MLRHIWAWVLSILLHALLIFSLFFFCNNWQQTILPAGDFNFFYLQATPSSFSTVNSVKSTNIASKQKNIKSNKIQHGSLDSKVWIPASAGMTLLGTSAEPTTMTGNGASGNATFGSNETKKILSQIRKKIEKAKHYPVMAKNKGIEGKSQIRFQLNSDGSIKNLLLSRSSGFEILDTSALEAVKLAAPYPYYPGPIQFELKFQLSSL